MELTDKRCAPCEGGTPPLSGEEAQSLLQELNASAEAQKTPWTVTADERQLKKGFKLKNFVEAVDFVNRIKDVAEEESHHPDLEVGYGKVVVRLTTHAIGGLSENDFILAAKIDALRS
ncbi:pterin-4-alpha-carbinolamine dehydratase [Thiohalorhabdus denitrificans]|uniref:Putative pterin-4-alpha-carbinolamine dehydratase n=1 Tax=Thiohalorhabdus denitrificans TaxID=381306 RepID=A0A0P9CMC0_9GAMM|nr:4a-hydroxytetrahydrobiopterin dehydratase [Thiohalorhabdus denitrificans]KPV40207.1 pterin-4-alpha-carbinolamine dehydratase [Thiohalorhabdus denitrificans]SCX84501.1 4a-hydroxytetrahydrobiopterin dehydratase [Thiohalorhabdus denitrificans]